MGMVTVPIGYDASVMNDLAKNEFLHTLLLHIANMGSFVAGILRNLPAWLKMLLLLLVQLPVHLNFWTRGL